MFVLKDIGLAMNELLLAGTLFSVRQNAPFEDQEKHTGG
jgi:hypothetical protein